MRLIPNGEGPGTTAEGDYREARRRDDHADCREAERERHLRTLCETGRGWEPYGASVTEAVGLHRKVRSRTGVLYSAFSSNDGVHLYEGVALAMRQQILAECARSALVLPARFEFASPNTVMTVFWGMRERGYFS